MRGWAMTPIERDQIRGGYIAGRMFGEGGGGGKNRQGWGMVKKICPALAPPPRSFAQITALRKAHAHPDTMGRKGMNSWCLQLEPFLLWSNANKCLGNQGKGAALDPLDSPRTGLYQRRQDSTAKLGVKCKKQRTEKGRNPEESAGLGGNWRDRFRIAGNSFTTQVRVRCGVRPSA